MLHGHILRRREHVDPRAIRDIVRNERHSVSPAARSFDEPFTRQTLQRGARRDHAYAEALRQLALSGERIATNEKPVHDLCA